jgi:hypothetical protein
MILKLDDVAALIDKVRKATITSLKGLVSAALRDGLVRMMNAPTPLKKFHTTPHFAGRCYLPNLDKTAEVLAIADGASFK